MTPIECAELLYAAIIGLVVFVFLKSREKVDDEEI